MTLVTPLQQRGGNGTGGSTNVVNIVRYQIRNLKAEGDARWTPLFNASSAAPGEDDRTELVREELDADGAVIAGSSDIVAEYAVDSEFSVTGQLLAATPTTALVTSIPGDSNFQQFFAPAMTGDRPQGVRTVGVRFSVRSREADRPSNITAGGLYRFKLGDNLDWARVRTFQSEIALPNQSGVQW